MGDAEARVEAWFAGWRSKRRAECESFLRDVHMNLSLMKPAHAQSACHRLEHFLQDFSGDSLRFFLPKGFFPTFRSFATHFDGDWTGLDRFEYCADPWLFMGNVPAQGGVTLSCAVVKCIFPELTKITCGESIAVQKIAWKLHELLASLRFQFEQTVLAPLTAMLLRESVDLLPPLTNIIAEYAIIPSHNNELRQRKRGIMVEYPKQAGSTTARGHSAMRLYGLIHNEWRARLSNSQSNSQSSARPALLADHIQISEGLHLRIDRISDFVAPLFQEWRELTRVGWYTDKLGQGDDPDLSLALQRWIPPNCSMVGARHPEFNLINEILEFRFQDHPWIFTNQSLRIPLISAIIHHLR